MERDQGFGGFAKLPVYKAVNAKLVLMVPDLQLAEQIVDVGAGTGLITDFAASGAPDSRTIAIEPDKAQIEKAVCYVGANRDRVDFVQARAEDILPGMPESFADVVFFCNAIHLLTEDEKANCVQWIHRILRPGGHIVINTAFAVESTPQHTRKYYFTWLKTAKKRLPLSFRNASRKNGGRDKSQARRQLTRDSYLAMLCDNGFTPVVNELSDVEISRGGWEAICDYWLFLEGILPGVPYPLATEALIGALDEAFAGGWPADWTRRWVQLVGRKK
jgi:ubiquinone/menaquinone biosynthesis C-methylase UbiE